MVRVVDSSSVENFAHFGRITNI